jgi:membrane-associated phospholipid phosphatase
MKSKWISIAVLIATLFSGTAFAAEGSRDEQKPRELRYNLRMDLVVTGIAATGYVITTAAKDQLLPSDCRWCDANSFDKWGHDNIKWSNTGAANKAVYVTGYALAPIAAFGLDAFAAGYDGRLSDFLPDALVIAEAAALSSFTAELVKIATGRQRPYAHFGGGSTTPRDNNSFYSGHTTLAFSLAVSSGTVATMRGYRFAPLVWGTGLAIAATTGYLSLAADRHYLTDVITGAALGSAFGFGIPYLFHRPREEETPRTALSAFPVEGGGLLTVSGIW